MLPLESFPRYYNYHANSPSSPSLNKSSFPRIACMRLGNKLPSSRERGPRTVLVLARSLLSLSCIRVGQILVATHLFKLHNSKSSYIYLLMSELLQQLGTSEEIVQHTDGMNVGAMFVGSFAREAPVKLS